MTLFNRDGLALGNSRRRKYAAVSHCNKAPSSNRAFYPIRTLKTVVAQLFGSDGFRAYPEVDPGETDAFQGILCGPRDDLQV